MATSKQRYSNKQTATAGIGDTYSTTDIEALRTKPRRKLSRQQRNILHKDELYTKKKGGIRENVEVILSAVVIAIIIRIFFVEAFMIPSPSMYPSLKIGDHLLVNKFFYGIRIPVVNIKLPGFSQPNSGDIVVFQTVNYTSPGVWRELLNLFTFGLAGLDNIPDIPKLLIKRAIGVPGDIVTMNTAGEVERGNKSTKYEMVPLTHEYIGKPPNGYLDSHQKKYPQLTYYLEKNFDKEYLIQQVHDGRGESRKIWKGNLYIAKIGDKVRLTPITGISPDLNKNERIWVKNDYKVTFYTSEDEEITSVPLQTFMQFYLVPARKEYRQDTLRTRTILPTQVHFDIKRILSSGDLEYEYTFEKNYYLMLGDNRDVSSDSRYWGLLPEENIFGNPMFIYFPFYFYRFGSVEESSTSIRNDMGLPIK